MPDPTIVLLFGVVLTAAVVSASVGPAGGVVLATMALVLPAPAVVPVHAAVQLGGSTMRLGLLRHFVTPVKVAAFAAGAAIGFGPAVLLASRIDLPADLLRSGLGLATLVPLLLGQPARSSVGGRLSNLTLLGGWSSFLALFIGATGALIAAVLARSCPDPTERVATHTGCLVLQHGAKVVIYIALGFSTVAYLPLIGLLLVASAVGALLGRRILGSASEASLIVVFQIVTAGLGAYLVATGAVALAVDR